MPHSTLRIDPETRLRTLLHELAWGAEMIGRWAGEGRPTAVERDAADMIRVQIMDLFKEKGT